MRKINILISSIILLLSSASPVLADVGEARHEVKEVDGYKVKLTFIEGDVQLGHNKLNIQINDPQGQPVTNARVTVIAELYKEIPTDTTSTVNSGMDMGVAKNSTSPPEKPMQTVKVDLMAGSNTGEYEGEVELEEAGHWMIKVVSLIQAQEKVVEFVVEVHDASNRWPILLSFLGVIVAIMVVAAITRRKSAHTPALEEAI